MTETVTIEKKVFDVLQKNNLDLIEKLEKAKEALRFYADKREYNLWVSCEHYRERHGKVLKDQGVKARKALKEIGE